MKDFFGTIVISLLMTVYGTYWSPAASEENNPGATFQRFGVYVVSSDLKRSRLFYEKVFKQTPELVTDNLIGFAISGGLFAVASKAAYAQDSSIGGNVVPYIQVDDMEAAYAHLQTTVPEAVQDRSIIDEGVIKILKFTDPDGNIVEYYWLAE